MAVDCDRLFYTVCEKKAIAKKSILPSLWTYRSRVTLEHLLQMVKNERTCTILLEFLNQVSYKINNLIMCCGLIANPVTHYSRSLL